jgi:RNA polymerase sigma-70 factor (ECF subfamily)
VPADRDKRFSDEAALVAALKRKDEEAFSALVRNYQGRLFGIAYGMTQDREESLDIVQETFLKALQNIQTFRGDAGIATWLYRITVNLSLNWKRRWKRRLKRFHISLESDDRAADHALRDERHEPDAVHEAEQLENQFQRALKALPEEHRSVFVLKEVEGLSYEEISRVLRINKGTVSSRLFNARKKLKASMKPFLGQEKE